MMPPCLSLMGIAPVRLWPCLLTSFWLRKKRLHQLDPRNQAAGDGHAIGQPAIVS